MENDGCFNRSLAQDKMAATLVVGAGLTGAALARLLRLAGCAKGDVIVWDKNTIVGGRAMARCVSLGAHDAI